jgi:zinc protease
MLINEGMQLIAKNGVEAEKLNKVKEQMLKEYETNQRENSYWQSAETDFILDGKNTVAGVKEAIKALSSDQIKAFVNNNVLKQNNSLKVIIEPEK